MSNRDMDKIQRKASVLIDALPYLRDFNQKIAVITYLCNDQLTGDEEQSLMQDIAILHSVGMKPIIVHDTRMGADTFRENKRLAKLVEFCGPKAVGICGVDEQTLHMTLNNGYIPVVTPYDVDTEHSMIRTEDCAREIATLLKTEKLIFLDRENGIDDENGEHVYRMTESELKTYMETAELSEHMKSLLENAVAAITGGVNRVHIIEGKITHAILLELFSMKGVGTVFTDDEIRMYSHEKARTDRLATQEQREAAPEMKLEN